MDLHSRASRLCDQNFAMCISPQDKILPFYNVQCKNYYRPWKCCAENFKELGSIINFEKDCFKIMLDVQQFQPNEIYVKVNDREITIEGKHEERQDEFGYVERQFTRRYFLPNDYSSENIIASLSSDKVLVITADKKSIDDHEQKTVQIKLCEVNLKKGQEGTAIVSGTTKDDGNDHQRELKDLNKSEYGIISNESQCSFIKCDQVEEKYTEDISNVLKEINEYTNALEDFSKVRLTDVSEMPEETHNKCDVTDIKLPEKENNFNLSSSKIFNYANVEAEETIDILTLKETTNNDETCVNNVTSSEFSETDNTERVLEKSEQSTLESSEINNNRNKLCETEESQESFLLLASESTNEKIENANEVSTESRESTITIDNLKEPLSELTSETVESKEMDLFTSKLENIDSKTKESQEFPLNINEPISDLTSATLKEVDDATAKVEKSLFNTITTVREKYNESFNLPKTEAKSKKSEIESQDLSCNEYDCTLSTTKEICKDITDFINDALKEVTTTANITEESLCLDIEQKGEDRLNFVIPETVIHESNISEVNTTQEMESSFDSTTVKDRWDYASDVASAKFKENDKELGESSKEITKPTKIQTSKNSLFASEEARTEIEKCTILSS